jgi:hypothetical protein
MATAFCTSDPDGDGVPLAGDKCPDTPRLARVNRDGCPDDDGDGVANPNDACSDTEEGATVDPQGCPRQMPCAEGTCSGSVPICSTAACKELEIPAELDDSTRRKIIEDFLRTGAHPRNCPNDFTAPDSPTITVPPLGINAIELGQAFGHGGGVAVTLDNGKVVGGDKLSLPFSWSAVNDDCEPVRYSVLIETYHCHSVPGLEDMATYLNEGWCRWRRYQYLTTTDTSVTIDLEIGRVLYDLHVNIYQYYGITPPVSGEFIAYYQPQWIRARVFTHDGNGATSSGEDERKYYVLYPEMIGGSQLVDIPMSPTM